MKVGRKKINCNLGEKQRHTINCYDFEWQQIKIFYAKLKRDRYKYYIKEEEG